MQPFLNVEEDSEEARFTKIICKLRARIEMTNGRLKEVFRCLNKERGLHYDPETVTKTIKASAVMHNFIKLDG